MLLKVNNYKLKKNNFKKKLIINLNTNNKKIKKPLYCFSGGGLIIINDKYIPVIKRSNTAPTNKNKLSTPSGKSEDIEEIHNPILLRREIFEELSFIKNHNIVNFTHYKNKSLINQNINLKKYNYLKRYFPNVNKRFKNFKLNKLRKYNSDEIILKFPTKKLKKIKCLFHISNKNEVNIFFIYNVKIKIEKLSIIDTEFMDKKKPIKPREVYILDRLNDDLFDSKFIKINKIENFSYTDHLQSIIDKLKKI